MQYTKLSVAGCAALMFGLIACSGEDGKDGVNGVNGLNGADGASCEVKSLKDESGYKVLCGGDSVGVLLNGKTGATGKQGVAGATGAKGDTGKTGESCTAQVNSTKDGYDVLCGGKVVGTLKNGAPGESCTTSEAEEGIKITCGTTSTVLKNKSCTVKETADKDGTKGLQMTCDDGTGGTVWNGKSGTSCTAKKDGDELKMYCDDKLVGSVTDGTSCVSTDNGEGVVTVKCGDAEPVVIAKAMCGDKTYDPADQFCAGVKLYDKCGTGTNKVTYKVNAEYCENGVVTPMCIVAKLGEPENPYSVNVTDVFMRAPKANEFCWNGFITKKCGGKEFGDYEYCGKTADNSADSIMTYCAPDYDMDKLYATLLKQMPETPDVEDDDEYIPDYFGMEALLGNQREIYTTMDVQFYLTALESVKVKATQFCVENELVVNKCGTKTFKPKEEFCDRRDNHIYKKVKIGNTWWMAENLAFEYKLPRKDGTNAKTAGKNILFEDTLYQNYANEAITAAGRYYTWASAIGEGDVRYNNENALPKTITNDLVDIDLDDDDDVVYRKLLVNELVTYKMIPGACPDGWRLPTREELTDLVTTYKKDAEAKANLSRTSGYYQIEYKNVAKPGDEPEYAVDWAEFFDVENAYLWTIEDASDAKAYGLMTPENLTLDNSAIGEYEKTLALPIRCVLADY